MKKIITIFSILSILTFCNAQNQIIDIQDNNEIQTGAYYKDTQNLLNPFVGTYLYINGSTSFTIILQKKEMSTPVNNRYYEDLIIGGYRFVKDGVEIINKLTILNNPIPLTNGKKYPISGNSIEKLGSPYCRDCEVGELALLLSLIENSTENWALLATRRILVNGQPAIKVKVQWQGPRQRNYGTPPLPEASFPGGTYILLKQ